MLDSRIVLSEGAELSFPGMQVRIGRVLGRGSNAIVYEGSYPDLQIPGQRHKVLVKELFPYSEYGEILRETDGSVIRSQSAEEQWELHRESFLRGAEVHLRLLNELPGSIEGNLNTFALNGTFYSVLAYSGGRTLEQEEKSIGSAALPAALLIRRMLMMADAVEDFHRIGFLHLDISPDNMLLIGDSRRERITLIDYNSVHTLSEVRQGINIYFSAKDGFTAPEVLKGRLSEMGESSDLYSLCAVFCHMLTGEKLSPGQRSHGTAPSISRMPAFSGAAETVKSKLLFILRRGISPLVSCRYHHIQELREDLLELQERLEGRGISTAALWETGRARVRHILHHNPAFSFVEQDEKLYPICVSDSVAQTCFLSEWTEMMRASTGRTVLLTGDGGAGKTTTLLRMVWESTKKYSEGSTAFGYVPLYGWQEGNDSFIRDSLLSELSFSPDTVDWAGARHELESLMRRPIYGGERARPRLLILLDGFNEINGSGAALREEIRLLESMPGVRMIISSRGEAEELAGDRYRLKPLEDNIVNEILKTEGVLKSESPEVMTLLHSPLMLSMYLSLGNGSQLVVKSSEELIGAYLKAITDKQSRWRGEDSDESFRIQAAVYYLLPLIAAEMNRQNRPLTDRELLSLVKKSYDHIRKSSFLRDFRPYNWIGHRRDILGGAKDAEEWYKIIILQLLWKRLGLLFVDEEGRYSIFHSQIQEYLLTLSRPIERHFRHIKWSRGALAVLAASVLIVCAYMLFREERYDIKKAENVLAAAEQLYWASANQYETMLGLMEEDNGGEEPFRPVYKAVDPEGALAIMMDSGNKMPWSGTHLDREEGESFLEAYELLITLPEERQERYSILLQGIRLYEAQGLALPEGAIRAYLEADAKILSCCYHLILTPELKSMGYDRQASLQKTNQMFENQNRVLSEMETVDYGVMSEIQSADIGNIRIAVFDASNATSRALTEYLAEKEKLWDELSPLEARLRMEN